jgi:hypothetical protein
VPNPTTFWILGGDISIRRPVKGGASMFLRRPPAVLVLVVAVDRLARGLGVTGFREIPRGGLDRRDARAFP